MSAAFHALRFRSGTPQPICELPQQERNRFLAFTDRTQLTLALAERWPAELPDWLVDAIGVRLEKNKARWQKVKLAYTGISCALNDASLDYTVLKGFSSVPDFFPEPWLRVQYDIDLLLSGHGAAAARDALLAIGYEPMPSMEGKPTDHLPAMVRKSFWEWKGDYFDSEIPVSVDLHFRLWDEITEAIPAPGLDDFAARRQPRVTEGLHYTALGRPDALAYAALHLLRHLLRGSLRPAHAYELAWFLEHAAHDREFWKDWRRLHPPGLKQLQALCFSLVHRWHECLLPPDTREEIDMLPDPVVQWLDEFESSPLNGLHRPNKDEIWLHLTLVNDVGSRRSILLRRLFPAGLPGPVSGVYASGTKIQLGKRLRAHLRHAGYIALRAAYHARALVSFAANGIRWQTKLPAAFWWYFLGAALFDIGLFIFFLLYNIYLIEIGFSEQLLGTVSGAMTAGSLAGSLGAAYALKRWDVRRCLTVTLSVLAAGSGLRALVTTPSALIVVAAACGVATSVWAVLLAPTVAMLTPERVRPRAFSFIFAAGIALGVAGGLAGGNLPKLLMPWTGSHTASLRVALLLSCVIVLAGIFPMRRLPASKAAPERGGKVRVTPFLRHYLAAIALWHAGTGSFNPFFNAFFLRLGFAVPQIGAVFSLSQAVQTMAVLAAPFILRRAGMMRGIALMQGTTGATLLLLALTVNPAAAAAVYAIYMAVQYMNSPGMYSLLMASVPAASRGTASALNFAVAFGCQALASAVAGSMIARVGYSPVLVGAAMLCGAAAAAFLLLRPSTTRSEISEPQSGNDTTPACDPAPTHASHSTSSSEHPPENP